MLDIGNGGIPHFREASGSHFPTDLLEMENVQGSRHFQISKAIFTDMKMGPAHWNDRAIGQGRALGAPSNPAWGTGTLCPTVISTGIVHFQPLMGTGTPQPDPSALPFRLLPTPHGERERNRRATGPSDPSSSNPSWGTGTPSTRRTRRWRRASNPSWGTGTGSERSCSQMARVELEPQVAPREGMPSLPARSIRSRSAAPSTMSRIPAQYPTPFTSTCDGHPLAPIAGPIVV
jgi:hypothetical protein